MPNIFSKQEHEPKESAPTAAEVRMRALDDAEEAIDAALGTGRADRARITRKAQLDAAEAVARVGEAMEADEHADEMARLAIIAGNMGDPQKGKAARKRAKDARKQAKHMHRTATKSAKDAYNAIKFSQPGKLGFMRVVQLVYAFNIAGVLLALLLTSRDTITYNSVTIVDWITIVLQGVGFWFFINYFKITKKYVVYVAAFSLVAGIVSSIATNTFSAVGALFGIAWNLFLILYFLFSKRVDTVLVNDFSTFKPRQQAELRVKRRSWPYVRNLIIYFIVFSVLGHWMEAAMCQLIRLGLVQGEYDPTNTMLWRDWLYPYPMEGAAVVIIALVLYPLWQSLLRHFERPIWAYVVSFFANALTCSVIEFSMGLIVNADHQLWDYSEMFGNIMGQVCLQNTVAFGVAASVIAWFVYPMMERWLARIPNDTMNIAFVIIAVIGGILWSLYIVDPPENHQMENLDKMATAAIDDPALVEKDLLSSTVGEMGRQLLMLQQQLDDAGNISTEDRSATQEEIKELKQELDELTATLDTGAQQSVPK